VVGIVLLHLRRILRKLALIQQVDNHVPYTQARICINSKIIRRINPASKSTALINSSRMLVLEIGNPSNNLNLLQGWV